MLKLAAPVIHVDQWGKPYNDTTPSLLTRLTDIASLGAEEGSVSPDRDDEPGLVVSIEADAIEFGWHSWVSADSFSMLICCSVKSACNAQYRSPNGRSSLDPVILSFLMSWGGHYGNPKKLLQGLKRPRRRERST